MSSRIKFTATSLKASCHAIRADYLLIETAHTHMVNEQWAWKMADKYVRVHVQTCLLKLALLGVQFHRYRVGSLALLISLLTLLTIHN